MNRLIKYILVTLILLTTQAQAQEVIGLFPLTNYDQNISTWINPTAVDYDQALLPEPIQQQKYAEFYDHYFGNASPWNEQHICKYLKYIASEEQNQIGEFDNENKPEAEIGYGLNFTPYTKAWINHLATNMNLPQFAQINYDAAQRAIAIHNTPIRSLPTNDPFYYHHTIAGQGYPFDLIQVSSLWSGTPIYIVGSTQDKRWSFVITPDVEGWVESRAIAKTSQAFIDQWQTAAHEQLAAITKTNTSIIDEQDHYLFSAYVGSVFPAVATAQGMRLMVPNVNSAHAAIIDYALVDNESAVRMPYILTPHHFAMLIKTLLGRPYGWGNLYFDNDCSAELKSLFTPFGIWLPRHSTEQVKVGSMIDLSQYDLQTRLNYLITHGKPFLTILYIGGHVMLYIGNHAPFGPMTYQNVWGLRPTQLPDRRAIIGKSVFFPLLASYSEDPTLKSQAGRDVFQMGVIG